MAKIKKGKVKAVKPLGRKAMAKAIEFVEEYLRNGRNGTRAYLKVYPGYKENTAATASWELLKKPEIVEYLAKRDEELRAKYRLTTDDVIRSLSQALHFDPAKLYNEDGSLKKVTELDEDTRMALASVEVVEMAGGMKIDGDGGIEHVPMFTKKVKWIEKNPARDQAMKHLGLYDADNVRKLQLTGKDGKALTIKLTPSEAYKRLMG